jgi:excinuclease UvrABC nuclease subunit
MTRGREALGELANPEAEIFASVKTAFRRRLSKVLPLDEQPDMAIMSGLALSTCEEVYDSLEYSIESVAMDKGSEETIFCILVESDTNTEEWEYGF